MRRMQQLLKLLDIELPIILAPMAGNSTVALTAAVSNAGGLGSHACAMLSAEQVIEDSARVRALTNRSFNLNFFCHTPPGDTQAQERAWREKLSPYYKELGVDPAAKAGGARRPFNEEYCDAVLKVGPKIASFHFGLPKPDLVRRMKDAGIVILCSATTSAEAKHVVDHGADAVIAQGFEAGGHRGIFLSGDRDIASQVGTMALVPQVVDAVDAPVIATGGIADARGVAAAFALGAAAVQVGTAYLFCPEAKVSLMHRAALKSARDDSSVLTTVFTGRPARGIVNRVIRELGPMSEAAPPFPNAANALTPLRAEAEKRGSGDFSPLWTGQAASLAREMGAAELTRSLAAGARELLRAWLSGQAPSSRLHARWRDRRRGQADGVEGAAHLAGRLGLLDERADIGERRRLVERDCDRGDGIQKPAIENARARQFGGKPSERFARQRDGVCLARAHQIDGCIDAGNGDGRCIRR